MCGVVLDNPYSTNTFAWNRRPVQYKLNMEATAADEVVGSLEHVQNPVGMHHDEVDQEQGNSCTPRSATRDLEVLRRESRGTDLTSDADS